MAHSSDILHRIYPAMSHPTADPAVNAVAARFAGLEPPDPSQARILEIGCASGHHLLPLAMRWPHASFTGIDACPAAIHLACELAGESWLHERVDFHACLLEDFSAADGSYDYIIAHGFFSWVPDEVKQCLLEFCARKLSANGLAVISFNVAAGWRERLAVIRKVRDIQQSTCGLDEISALRLMKAATDEAGMLAIIDDMLAKGPAILAFDDFAPVNDPWRLDDLVSAAAIAGLRWLGESRVADNRPRGWTEENEAQAAAIRGSLSPVDLHQWMDERAKRTFRSALLCRADAPVAGRLRTPDVFKFSLRPEMPAVPAGSVVARRIHDCLMWHWPSAVPADVLLESLPDMPPAEIARQVCQAIVHGWLWARCQPLVVPSELPSHPSLDPFRLACARRQLPVVDAWHLPCSFPAAHQPLLVLLDGSRSLDELRSLAAHMLPQLDFNRWLIHLHERGLLLHTDHG
jgi:hypothetical protein